MVDRDGRTRRTRQVHTWGGQLVRTIVEDMPTDVVRHARLTAAQARLSITQEGSPAERDAVMELSELLFGDTNMDATSQHSRKALKFDVDATRIRPDGGGFLA